MDIISKEEIKELLENKKLISFYSSSEGFEYRLASHKEIDLIDTYKIFSDDPNVVSYRLIK